ncbi:hypothetical protein CP532_3173 [Ophiocordyceps camponoti-leonardi (nom. inval.)]|nr:hypothetical protein CP532_3173 [Ophiocordyceps camponoti-leonardi (nom. inval.)]
MMMLTLQRRRSALFLALALSLLIWPSGIIGARPGEGIGDGSLPGGDDEAHPGSPDEAHPGTPDEAGTSGTQQAQPQIPTFVQTMEPHEFVYVIVDGESDFTPLRCRSRGGLLVEEDGFDTFVVDMAYGYETAESSVEESAYERVSRDLIDSMNTIYSSPYGWWIYRIAASPNMVPTVLSYKSYSHMALGGIQWTQIHSWTIIQERFWGEPELLDWTLNGEYNSSWEAFGLNGRQPLLAGFRRPDIALSRRQLAVAFMNHLTSRNNTLLDEERRQTLRELLDWNAEAEPSRDFPLLRRPLAPDLTSSILSQIDWDNVPIPPLLRLLLSGGLASLRQCIRAMRAMRYGVDPGSGSGSMRRRSEENCDKLAEVSKDEFNIKGTDFSERPGTRSFCKSYHCIKRGAKLGKTVGKQKEEASKFTVKICEDENMKPNCVDVEAAPDECVVVPDNYKGRVSSLQLNSTTAACSFFTNGDCSGGTFELDPSEPMASLDSGSPLLPFNDKITSLRCREAAQLLNSQQHPSEVWTWSPEAQKSHCAEFDQLKIFFSLSGEFQAGTTDKLHLGFSNGVNMHDIKNSPPAGFYDWQDVDLQHVFGAPKVKVSSIRTVQLAATASWLSGLMGADEWKLDGLRIHGRCAGSGIEVKNDKFIKFSPPKALFVGDVFRTVRAHTKSIVWEEFINLDDWTVSPPCSHFKQLSVTLEIADEEYAGTTNDLYVVVNEAKFLIMSSPAEREVRTIPIDLEKAYGSKMIKVGDVNRIGIIPLHGHHNQCLPKSLTLRAICAGKDGKSLEIERNIGKWLSDAQQWSLDVTPDMWQVIQVTG